MVKLRGYQTNITSKVHAAWTRVMAVLAVLATGGGKTVIFTAIMHQHQGSAAAVVHRKEIISQISCSLAALGVKHRVIAPPKVVALIRRKHLKRFGKSFIDPNARDGVVSVQTLTSRSAKKNAELQRWIKQVTLCVFDEGHHYVKSGLWGRAVEMMGNIKLRFVTATPERADGKGLGIHADGYVEEMVEGPLTRWLMDQGYLSTFTYKCPKTDLNLEDIPITASGEVSSIEMRKRIVDSHLVGDVVDQWFEFAEGLKTIVFASDVKTAEELAERFRARGVRAESLNGDSDDTVRDHQLDEFEFGNLMVLVNVDLFDEGFDVPGVVCVIMARVTMSLAKFLQMPGRGFRPVYADGYDLETREGRLAAIAAGPKPHAVIIDPVCNWERHGMPHWPRLWSLDGREKGSRSAVPGGIPQRICVGTPERPGCTQPYLVVHKVCPHCGVPMAEPEGRSSPEQVDGDLIELDIAAMDALFAEIHAADMSDEDYAVNQVTRNVPSMARSTDMKHHQRSKYRRQVLHELVGWWVGAQKGRDMSEIHRRFYHRFGIDIGHAFTLKAKETDALMDKIKQNFSEDMTA